MVATAQPRAMESALFFNLTGLVSLLRHDMAPKLIWTQRVSAVNLTRSPGASPRLRVPAAKKVGGVPEGTVHNHLPATKKVQRETHIGEVAWSAPPLTATAMEGTLATFKGDRSTPAEPVVRPGAASRAHSVIFGSGTIFSKTLCI